MVFRLQTLKNMDVFSELQDVFMRVCKRNTIHGSFSETADKMRNFCNG